MSAPLSDYWAIEYHFSGDTFSVRSLPDYLTYSQRSFAEKKLFVSVILGLYPTREGANEVCEHWKDQRDERPISNASRAEEFRRYLDGLENAARTDAQSES